MMRVLKLPHVIAGEVILGVGAAHTR